MCNYMWKADIYIIAHATLNVPVPLRILAIYLDLPKQLTSILCSTSMWIICNSFKNVIIPKSLIQYVIILL